MAGVPAGVSTWRSAAAEKKILGFVLECLPDAPYNSWNEIDAMISSVEGNMQGNKADTEKTTMM